MVRFGSATHHLATQSDEYAAIMFRQVLAGSADKVLIGAALSGVGRARFAQRHTPVPLERELRRYQVPLPGQRLALPGARPLRAAYDSAKGFSVVSRLLSCSPDLATRVMVISPSPDERRQT